jgi:hypothetical protein
VSPRFSELAANASTKRGKKGVKSLLSDAFHRRDRQAGQAEQAFACRTAAKSGPFPLMSSNVSADCRCDRRLLDHEHVSFLLHHLDLVEQQFEAIIMREQLDDTISQPHADQSSLAA